MSELHKIRQINLVSLVGQWSNKAELATACGISKSQLSGFLSPTKPENIGNMIARRIEAANKLPEGWLDYPHIGALPDISVQDLLKISYSAVGVCTTLARNGVKPDDIPEKAFETMLVIAANKALTDLSLEDAHRQINLRLTH